MTETIQVRHQTVMDDETRQVARVYAEALYKAAEPSGQTEAAQSLGMSRLQTLRRIVLPQAMRVIVPPTGNETISMLKTTSLVAVIALPHPELLYAAQLIYAQSFQQIPLLIVVCIWYLAVTTLLTLGQAALERRYGHGVVRRVRAPKPAFRLAVARVLALRASLAR